MKTEYNFRKGNYKDLNQIKDLTLQAYLQFRNVISEENVEAWEKNLSNENTYAKLFEVASCFVCEHENNIPGGAFLIPGGNPYK